MVNIDMYIMYMVVVLPFDNSSQHMCLGALSIVGVVYYVTLC